MPDYEPKVSPHALERFRERICDLPKHEILAALLTDEIKALLRLGVSKISNLPPCRIIAREGVIVTVLPNDAPKHRPGGRRRRRCRDKRKLSA